MLETCIFVRIQKNSQKIMTKNYQNKNLHKAKNAKKDEFYTQLYDIENELWHYKDHFRDKVIYCNCDDPRVSKFFHYFFYSFEHLGLKKLIATCYKNQNPDLFSQNESERAIYLEYKRDEKGENIPYPEFMKSILQVAEYKGELDNPNVPKPEDLGINYLKGDGDFRSRECIELLKQADIVVTNPPFSLFREYVSQLIEYDKKFVIIGSLNAITYKEIFKFIKENKLWLGYKNGDMAFKTSDDYEKRKTRFWIDKDGQKWRSFGNIYWFTNLEIDKRNEELILWKDYTPEEYPKYDNYDAIEVSRTAHIPRNYSGAMGVPITFLDKFNPKQFEIIKFRKGNDEKDLSINGKCPYFRILIKNKKL